MNPPDFLSRGAAAALAAVCALSAPALHDGMAMCSMHTSGPFAGPKASAGTVTHDVRNGMHVLTLSEDFKIPDAPAPQWQVVDSLGNVYFLQRLMLKDGDSGMNRVARTVSVPTYVPDVKTVRIWCAWAEANLGEASFAMPIEIGGMTHTSDPFSGRKVNRGTVTHERRGEDSVLVLSADFVVPDSPAPHWQVVDSAGRTYLLDSLRVKGGDMPDVASDRIKRELAVPDYVPDVAKVQFWCAWAETLLGEASFSRPVR